MKDNTIKTIVRGTYDIQKLRVMTGLRIVANFKNKMGQEPSKKEETLSSEDKNFLNILRLSYNRITDGIVEASKAPSTSNTYKNFKSDGLIDTFAEYILIDSYIQLERKETEQFKYLEYILKEYPIYTEYLADIKGVGPAMAGVIISEFDIYKAKYPSSLFMYAGWDVAEDGKGRSKRKEHLVEVEYVDKKGETKTKKAITHNPFIKSKLWLLGTIFIKQNAEKCKYRKIYDDYKIRLQCRPDLKELSKAHINNMCIRYIVKQFLIDLHVAWREIEGLPVAVPYHEAKLGLKHKEAS